MARHFQPAHPPDPAFRGAARTPEKRTLDSHRPIWPVWPVEITTSLLKLRANATEGQKAISYQHFYELFTDIVTDLGMKTRDAWIITPQGHVADHEAYGYESFHRLWGKDDHPDGLLVFPDTSARGVMTAALELGVRVPADIQMVFHHNTGVDWTCPLAVDWVENDTAQWAAEMIKQVRRQKAGEKIEEPTVLGYRIVETGDKSGCARTAAEGESMNTQRSASRDLNTGLRKA